MITARWPPGLYIAFLLLFLCRDALAAPSAKPWPRWNQQDPDSSLTIDHAAWNEWLGKFVSTAADGITRVAYASVTPADRARLRTYIDSLEAVPISNYSRAEQLAYWINLYNALTIDIVIEHYPLDSIRDISSGLFSRGPWRLKLARVEGVELKLDDIEHRILRPIWQDPRIHYAVNCAALGCPNLQSIAFTAANSEGLLDRAAVEFVNSERGVRIEDHKLLVSSIYHWFEDDFGGNESGVIAHLRGYAEAGLAAQLADIDSIDDHAYDWSLNEAR